VGLPVGAGVETVACAGEGGATLVGSEGGQSTALDRPMAKRFIAP
jgi:hypothetical protein